jgi:hypothetical protein
MSGSKLLDEITLYVQFVSTSCLVQNVRIESPCMFKLVSTSCVVQNVWMESPFMFPSFEPDMKNRQVEYTGWFHLKVLNQTWSTDRLNIKGDSIQTMFNLSVLHVWFKTWIEPPCMFNLSVLHVWFKTFGWNDPVCSSCQYFMSGSEHTGCFHPKVLNQTWRSNNLNIQGDSIQKF